MGITVKKEIYITAPSQYEMKSVNQNYVYGDGLTRVEYQTVQKESDFAEDMKKRYSEDNGKTFGPWLEVPEFYEQKGKDEMHLHYGPEVYNPVHGHFVSLGIRRVYQDGHQTAYKKYWSTGELTFYDHCVLLVRKSEKEQPLEIPVQYEEGPAFDPEDWVNPKYIVKNRAYFGSNTDVMDNGDILFALSVSGEKCLEILDVDIEKLFGIPAAKYGGMIVARGTFDPSKGRYDLTYSRPMLISPLKSSRGVGEPTVAALPGGRIVAVFRGSNVLHSGWGTLMQEGVPAHKWFSYSDDGGKTFTDPVPWHFDDREVFYSSASISTFVRSIKNNKIYWIGNISDHTAYGNYPRHPLVIAEVNDKGLMKKDTLTVIDKKEEGESDKLQLSNFFFIQDRETKRIELFLNKLEQHEGYVWWADCVRYFIDV